MLWHKRNIALERECIPYNKKIMEAKLRCRCYWSRSRFCSAFCSRRFGCHSCHFFFFSLVHTAFCFAEILATFKIDHKFCNMEGSSCKLSLCCLIIRLPFPFLSVLLARSLFLLFSSVFPFSSCPSSALPPSLFPFYRYFLHQFIPSVSHWFRNIH